MALKWNLWRFNPTADLVCNLTPDKQHTAVDGDYAINEKGNFLYSHGFNIVEEGMQIERYNCNHVRTKCPGSEVREEYKRGFEYQH
jgi:ketol-acid reductoisomerase